MSDLKTRLNGQAPVSIDAPKAALAMSVDPSAVPEDLWKPSQVSNLLLGQIDNANFTTKPYAETLMDGKLSEEDGHNAVALLDALDGTLDGSVDGPTSMTRKQMTAAIKKHYDTKDPETGKKDGKISMEEIAPLFEATVAATTAGYAEDLIGMVDTDGSGTFDAKDPNGSLDHAKFTKLLEENGIKTDDGVTDEEFAAFVKQWDTNKVTAADGEKITGDGLLQIEEDLSFIEALSEVMLGQPEGGAVAEPQTPATEA